MYIAIFNSQPQGEAHGLQSNGFLKLPSCTLAKTSAPLPPPTLPRPSRGKSSGVQTSTQQAMSSRPSRSTSALGKSSIVATPSETPSTTISEHQYDGSGDAPDTGSSRGGRKTLTGRELAQEALKIANNSDTAELMVLELMNKYSFSFPRLTELLRGKPVTRPFLSH
jgi:hypothetical protein